MSLSKIKVLLLNVNRTGWHSGNMVYDMMAVDKACDTTMYGPGWPNYKHTDIAKIIDQIYGDDVPDVIYSYFTLNERVGNVYRDHYKIPENLMNFPTNLKTLESGKYKDVKRIFALSDFWARKPNQFSSDLGSSNFQYCFSCFAPPYSNPDHFFAYFDSNIRNKMTFVGYPRCVDKECFKDYGIPKKHDVITVGAMWNFYPFRMKMNNYLHQHSKDMGIVFKNYSHCGVNFRHSGFVREEYAKAINKSKMLASCGGKYQLAMNKIFESMGCCTAYVGQEFYGEKELHMKDGFNYIAVTKKDFPEKIKFYANNEKELKEIIENAKVTFKKYHHIDARAGDLVKLLNGIL